MFYLFCDNLLPVVKWHGQIGDPTVADSILDRLVHTAHRIDLQGDSIRKIKGGRGGKNVEYELGRAVFLGANSSRPTGSFRQRQKPQQRKKHFHQGILTKEKNKIS